MKLRKATPNLLLPWRMFKKLCLERNFGGSAWECGHPDHPTTDFEPDGYAAYVARCQSKDCPIFKRYGVKT